MILPKKKFHHKISFIQYYEDKYYIGFYNGLFQIYSNLFQLLLDIKKHNSMILKIFLRNEIIITFSTTETILWNKENFSILKRMNNGLFFKIIPIKDNIVFGSISGDLFYWNLTEDKLEPIFYSYHIKPIKDIIHISKKFILSYSSHEIFLWKVPSLQKKFTQKKEKEWISSVSIFKEDTILIGFYDISIYSIEPFQCIKKIENSQEKISSFLSLSNNYFLISTENGTIYLYLLEEIIKREIIEKRFLESSFSLQKTRKNIFFFLKDTIFSFQNPLLQKEEENYYNFLKNIENYKKEHSIFHNRDLIFSISTFLF